MPEQENNNAVADTEQTESNKDSVAESRLTPIDFSQYNYTPGRYAPFYCSPEPCYGPDQLGEYLAPLEDLCKQFNKAEAASRVWEVLQAWEQRLFRRGYHFLNAGRAGWAMYGSGQSGGSAVMQTQNAMKLFACNVYGARCKKIVALLTRSLPPVAVVAENEDNPEDQCAAEEAAKYLEIFKQDASLEEQFREAANYFYTDDRVGFLTYTIADQTRWGTETPDIEQVFGEMEGAGQGVAPENEGQPAPMQTELPSRREVTKVAGKLEMQVPIIADDENQMGWKRFMWEEPVARLKAMYPWVKDKITGGTGESMQQYDRMARINVRLAVQASSSSGEAYKSDGTHSVTFIEPYQYESMDKEEMRDFFYQEFPDGLEVWHAGGQIALIRNCRSSRHVKVIHCTPGDGQNRESIGSYYLPLQKVLNANISLLDRYFRAAVPSRWAGEPYINTDIVNKQSNDPAKVRPVAMSALPPGTKISDLISVEAAPVPNPTMVEFIQWLIEGGPEAMDGASQEIFGASDNDEDQGVYRTARLRRDEARGIFNLPWKALCSAMSAVTLQAIQSAAENRIADINSTLPGSKRLKVELAKLQGSVLVHPISEEIPQTLSEQEERMNALIEQSGSVALYAAIISDPRNLQTISKFPTMADFTIPGADQVEQQQGEFEILLKSGPIPSPQLAAAQEQLALLQTNPMAQTPEGQQQMAQAQQAVSQIPPLISTVPVAQDTSENHMIHATITLGMMTSPTGRKLKYGDDQQKAIFQNLKLHWQEHMTAAKQLTPPKEMEFKGSVSIDPSKFPPQAQTEMFEAMGLQIPPFALQAEEQTHEITEEKQGVDENGVPVKQKISVVGKPLQQ